MPNRSSYRDPIHDPRSTNPDRDRRRRRARPEARLRRRRGRARPTPHLLPPMPVRVHRRRVRRHPWVEARRLARAPRDARAAHAAVDGPSPVPVRIRRVVVVERLGRPRFRALRGRRRRGVVREGCLLSGFARDGVEERLDKVLCRPHAVRRREPLRLHVSILVRVREGCFILQLVRADV